MEAQIKKEILERKKNGTYDTMKSFLAWKEKMEKEKGSKQTKVTIFDLNDDISDDEDDEWTPGDEDF